MQAWHALPVPEQERVIGRTKLEDVELADDVKPANSHVALNVVDDADGNQLQIVRANMPFGRAGTSEYGTYRIGYSRTPAVTERMLRNMYIGDPPGNTDRILDFSTAVTGTLFFTPTADFLDNPPPLPGTQPRGNGHDLRFPHRPRRIPADRQSERTPPMNNLYRELAPITEAAWREIGVEASRTFKRHIAGRRVVDVNGPTGSATAAVSTGHLRDVTAPGAGVIAHLRDAQPLVRLRVPFTLSRAPRSMTSSAARKASDWDPVKDAAKKLAFAEDRAIFEGYAAASIQGIRACSSNQPLAASTTMPASSPTPSHRRCPRSDWPGSTAPTRCSSLRRLSHW